MSDVSYRCEQCDAPCTMELTAGSKPRMRLRCTACTARYDVRLTLVEAEKQTWRIVHPTGDEVTFTSRDELRRAVLGNRFDPRTSSPMVAASPVPPPAQAAMPQP